MKRFHITHGRDPSADCDFVRKDMHSEKMSGKDRREWGEYNDEFHEKAEVAGFIAFPLQNYKRYLMMQLVTLTLTQLTGVGVCVW